MAQKCLNRINIIIIVHEEKKNYYKISVFNLPVASVNIIILSRCPAYEHFTYSWNRKLCSLKGDAFSCEL